MMRTEDEIKEKITSLEKEQEKKVKAGRPYSIRVDDEIKTLKWTIKDESPNKVY